MHHRDGSTGQAGSMSDNNSQCNAFIDWQRANANPESSSKFTFSAQLILVRVIDFNLAFLGLLGSAVTPVQQVPELVFA